jgi:hypothetical protein
MIHWFKNLLYGSVPATFSSDFPLDESVRRLTAATRRSAFSTLSSEAAVGRVSASGVSLQRVLPYIRNSFKPFFIGEFQTLDGRVVLAGRFTLAWFVKVFMTIWLGFCASWTVSVAIAVIASSATPKVLPFGGVLMFTLGCGFVAFAKKLSAKDVPWLSRVIQQALSKDPACTTRPARADATNP